MIAKVISVWLVALILSPCTAPFSTFDLTTVMGRAADRAAVRPPRVAARTVATTEARSGFVVAGAAARFERLRRIGLSHPVAASAIGASIRSAAPLTAPTVHSDRQTAITTILRV